jgi:predicted membrane channel-forming protein YqfA (hemolysin III family)
LYFYANNKSDDRKYLLSYDPKEERINAYSHGIGAVLALIASILLIIKGQHCL